MVDAFVMENACLGAQPLGVLPPRAEHLGSSLDAKRGNVFDSCSRVLGVQLITASLWFSQCCHLLCTEARTVCMDMVEKEDWCSYLLGCQINSGCLLEQIALKLSYFGLYGRHRHVSSLTIGNVRHQIPNPERRVLRPTKRSASMLHAFGTSRGATAAHGSTQYYESKAEGAPATSCQHQPLEHPSRHQQVLVLPGQQILMGHELLHRREELEGQCHSRQVPTRRAMPTAEACVAGLVKRSSSQSAAQRQFFR